MRKNITQLIVILALLLSGCQGKQILQNHQDYKTAIKEKQQPPTSFYPISFSVVQLGDSLTEGVGDIHKIGGYTSYLTELLNTERGVNDVEFLNYGKRGNRSDQLLKRIQTTPEIKHAVGHADVAIITIGGNDVMASFKKNMLHLEMEKFKEAEVGYSTTLEEIIQTVREYNDEIYIILVGIYNPFSKWFSSIKEMDEITENWNQTSVSILSQFDNTTFVPVADIFDNHEEELLHTDFFHPNNTGYERMAQRIFEYIQKEDIVKEIRE